jgi:hypothetical protein
MPTLLVKCLFYIYNNMYSFLVELIREFLSTTWVEKVIDGVRYYLAVNCVAENDWYVACNVLNFGKMWSYLCRLWGMGYAMVPNSVKGVWGARRPLSETLHMPHA